MLMEILTKTPVWVWPLFVLLVVIGLRAAHDRWVPATVIYFLPLLGLLSINNMLALPNQVVVWVLFIAVYALGLLFGVRLQGAWLLGRKGHRIHVSGEWVTMTTIVAVSLASFFNGLLVAIAPEVVALPAVYLGLTALKGFISGIFIGRAICVWRFMQAIRP